MGFVELWSLGAGNTYFALKNWKRDITKDYKVTSQEQQFHGDHYDAVSKNYRNKFLKRHELKFFYFQARGGFVNIQGTRVDHLRDEIGSDDDGPRMIGI